MGRLMSSGFGRDGFRPDHGHRFGPGRTSFSFQSWEHRKLRWRHGRPVGLVAPTNHPCGRDTRHHRTRSGDSRTSCSAKAEPRRSEGSLPSGADHRATPLYSVGPQGPDHDAVMRIGGEAPGRRAHSRKRCQTMACFGWPPPRIVSGDRRCPVRQAPKACPALPSRCAQDDASWRLAGGHHAPQCDDLLDNVAKFSIGFVHTIAREALRRRPSTDPMLKDASRSGRARPVQDGVHHGQAIQGTPTLQP
jgi:hypothetical protein